MKLSGLVLIQRRDGIEYFQYKKVLYTRLPFVLTFIHTLYEGVITLDHLIKRRGWKGR